MQGAYRRSLCALQICSLEHEQGLFELLIVQHGSSHTSVGVGAASGDLGSATGLLGVGASSCTDIKCEGIDPCQAAGMIIYEDAPKVATVQCMIHLGTEVHGHVLCKQMASLPIML